jgi:hypothetical protein
METKREHGKANNDGFRNREALAAASLRPTRYHGGSTPAERRRQDRKSNPKRRARRAARKERIKERIKAREERRARRGKN